MNLLLTITSIVFAMAAVLSFGTSAYFFAKIFRSGFGISVIEVVFIPDRLPTNYRDWRGKWLLSTAAWLILSIAAAACSRS